jgi:hypothetical protein
MQKYNFFANIKKGKERPKPLNSNRPGRTLTSKSKKVQISSSEKQEF